MISPETTNDILAEIGYALNRVADALDRMSPTPAKPDPDPYHDEGNATNHRLSQCTDRCNEL